MRPNYQVTRAGGEIETYRGSNHARMGENEFVPKNLSVSFSGHDLARLRAGLLSDAGGLAASIAIPDLDANRLLDAYSDGGDPHFREWLPRYAAAVRAIAESLRSGEHADAFSRVWREQNNSVSNAGQGALSARVVHQLRAELGEILNRIYADGSPENHDAILTEVEQWKHRGLLRSVPRLVVARAFASVHPETYHTTVDATRHERVIEWCRVHLRFVPPMSASWAQRAAALTAHLETVPSLRGRMLERNMFPWFVEMHSAANARRARAARAAMRGERNETTVVVVSPERQREISFHENRLQNQLARELRVEFGNDAVWIEKPTGNGTRADIFVVEPDGTRRLYEIKVETRALLAIRNALGQLIEYSYLPGGLRADALIVAAEPEFDSPASEFIDALREHLNLAISYRRIVLPASGEGGVEDQNRRKSTLS